MVEPRTDASALVRATGEILVELRDLVKAAGRIVVLESTPLGP